MVMKNLRKKLFGGVALPTPTVEKQEDDFIELSAESGNKGSAKIMLKYFVLSVFEDVKPVIDALREGFTICLVKMTPLQQKDKLELRRAVQKLKKTALACDGEVVGIDENWVVAVPSYVEVFKGEMNVEPQPPL